MDDQTCPRCRTNRYRNPNLRLMVNVCGHSLCISCVDLLFIKGSGNCPECCVPLKRSNFRLQLFEDSTIEKEVDIRKKILKDFNKKEEDFNSLEEYNDYLEEIEIIIYNLVNNIDVLETNKKVEQYRRENKDQINKNKMKFNKEVLELDRLLDEEQLEIEKREALEKQEAECKRRRIMEKEALIDELMFSDSDAHQILNYFTNSKNQVKSNDLEGGKKTPKKESKKISHFSSGVRIGDNNQLFTSVPKLEEGPLYVYVKPEIVIDGPVYPLLENLESLGYLKHVRTETVDEKAGGFQSNMPCMRALQEAMFGLYNTHIKIEPTGLE